MDSLDEFVNNLQEQIFDDARYAYGEKGFERWRNPRYQGKMTDADACGHLTGTCGDTIEIYLKFKNGIVKEASYFTDGCASSAISGSFAAEICIGKNPDEVIDIDGNAVIKAIGRLPVKDRHCADLAAAAIQEALSNYMKQVCKNRSKQDG